MSFKCLFAVGNPSFIQLHNKENRFVYKDKAVFFVNIYYFAVILMSSSHFNRSVFHSS